MKKHSQFQYGAIIKRPLDPPLGIIYSHMGIYAGSGKVIHFDSPGSAGKGEGSRVVRSSLAAFSAGRDIRLHASPASKSHAKAIVAEAERLRRTRKNGFNDSYDLFFRNCESFTTHCYEVSY